MESKIGSLSSCRSRLYASGNPFRVASSPVRLPINRPALPRASSATSGFFFCGMMLEPVDHSSAKRANPNSWVTQMITSSLSRERSTAICAQMYAASATTSRADGAVDRVGHAGLESELHAPLASGSRPSEVPARAADPYGLTASRRSRSRIRSQFRSSGQACASRWCESSTGCACCRWVRPGMATPR